MLRDVTEPQSVWSIGGELVPDPTLGIDDSTEVVVDRWTGLLAVLASRLPEH
jgi:hypothetical protein